MKITTRLAELRATAAKDQTRYLSPRTWRDVRGTYEDPGRARDNPCNPLCEAWPRSGKTYRWIERPEDVGLRLVGFSDEILPRMDHKGWYSDNYHEETYRGTVFTFPHGRFVHGYADPNNPPAALLCFELSDDKEDSAHAADEVARICAEREREYQAKESADCRIGELRAEIIETRATMRGLVREIKAAGRRFSPAICSALRSQLRDMRRGSREAYEEIEKLTDDFWAAVPA